MLKKPRVSLISYADPQCPHCAQSISVKPASATRHFLQSSKSPRLRYFQWRCYAATRSGQSSYDQTDDLFWPRLPSSNAIPTPYQILCVKRGDPYTKRRFYELAKIYHPDRSIHEDNDIGMKSLSGAVKIERYRMVVAAHEILSDPIKRRAYDHSGAGWNGHPEVGGLRSHWGQNHGSRWSGFDTNDSLFRNATWEDWEKWYQRDKAKQEPVYVSNGGFLIIVITAVFLGAFGQSIRLDEYSDVFKKQVEMIHEDASKGLQKRKTESTAFGSRNERLQDFLRSRDTHANESTDTMMADEGEPLSESEI